MAQEIINRIVKDDLSLTSISHSKVSCRLGITQEVIVKKVKGNLFVCLKEGGKSIQVSGDFFRKVLFLSESLQCVCALVH